jgi:ribosome-associated translation inhibitor RaiA
MAEQKLVVSEDADVDDELLDLSGDDDDDDAMEFGEEDASAATVGAAARPQSAASSPAPTNGSAAMSGGSADAGAPPPTSQKAAAAAAADDKKDLADVSALKILQMGITETPLSAPKTAPSTKAKSADDSKSGGSRGAWKQQLDQGGALDSSKRGRVAKEILTTEVSYSKGLKTVVHSFLVRLRVAVEIGAAVISTQEIDAIFGNIEEVAKLSEKMCCDLQELMDEKKLLSYIACTLLHYSNSFRAYQPYMENYDVALKEKQRTYASNESFRTWLDLQEKCEHMSLESFLIMPVQRLPRYLLLLEELRKNTDAEDPSLADINLAKERIQQIATDINQSLHALEGQRKVLAIQHKFEKDDRYMDLVTPTRLICKEGFLQKKFGKFSRHLSSWQEYYFFLFNDILVYSARTLLNTYKLKHVVPILDMKVTKQDKTQIEIKAKNGKSFTVAAASPEERDVWYEAFNKAIHALETNTREMRVQTVGSRKQKDGGARNAKLAAIMGVAG